MCEVWEVEIKQCHVVFTQEVREGFHSASQLAYLVGVSSSLAVSLLAPAGPSLAFA